MDGLALFVPFLMITAAHEATLAQYRYASAAQYDPPYVYAVAPGSGWAPGAAIGAGVGALAGGGHAGPALAGALIGGSIGYSASMPPVYATPAAYAPPPPPPPSSRARPGSADAFIANWMSFMQPR